MKKIVENIFDNKIKFKIQLIRMYKNINSKYLRIMNNK